MQIKNILHYRKPALWIIVMAIFAVAVPAAGLILNPKRETSRNSPHPSDLPVKEGADSNATADMEYDSFYPLTESKMESNLKSDRKENDVEHIFHITGDFDVNSDGITDEIKISMGRSINNQKSEVRVNDKSHETTWDNPWEAFLTDLDIRDKYKEIVVYDDGPSGDPQYIFFRYDGSDIIELGTIGGSPKINGCGRLITSCMDFISPEIILETSAITENGFQHFDIDPAGALGKKYTLAYDFDTYFEEFDSVPSDFQPSYDMSKMHSFKKDQKITLEKIVPVSLNEPSFPYWYEIQLENGKKGALYFWIGD